MLKDYFLTKIIFAVQFLIINIIANKLDVTMRRFIIILVYICIYI